MKTKADKLNDLTSLEAWHLGGILAAKHWLKEATKALYTVRKKIKKLKK